MSWKNFVTDYLSFSRKDRIGIYAILILTVVIYLLPRLFPKQPSALTLYETEAVKHKLDSALANRSEPTGEEEIDPVTFKGDYKENASGFTRGTRFPFDPNTLSEEGWRRLGLPDKAIRTLLNYRNKGGKFYRPDDLKKIWGLPEGFYAYVEEYITLEKREFTFRSPDRQWEDRKTERRILPVSINDADTAAFMALPMIGEKLATRIITFRNRLGGFYSVEQVRETYGLSDTAYQVILPYLQLPSPEVKKVNINTATKEELKDHPYIRWALANPIVRFRDKNGPFKTLEELLYVEGMEEEAFNKLKPYLTL